MSLLFYKCATVFRNLFGSQNCVDIFLSFDSVFLSIHTAEKRQRPDQYAANNGIFRRAQVRVSRRQAENVNWINTDTRYVRPFNFVLPYCDKPAKLPE